MTKIHPTSLVDPGAQLGAEVEIGPYSIIEAGATIGDRCRIGSHVVVHAGTTLGGDCAVDSGTKLGGEAQHRSATTGPSYVVIGEHNVIREYVTIHRSSDEGGTTRVGDHNLLMGFCHLGHDCVVGNWTTLTNLATVGGHCHIDDHANIGGMTAVHQKVRIGMMAMVGGMSGVNQDVPPFCLVEGNPAKVLGINVVGLRRRDIDAETRNLLKRATHILFCSGRHRGRAIEEVEQTIPRTPEIEHLLEFARATRDGRMGRQLER